MEKSLPSPSPSTYIKIVVVVILIIYQGILLISENNDSVRGKADDGLPELRIVVHNNMLDNTTTDHINKNNNGYSCSDSHVKSRQNTNGNESAFARGLSDTSP